MSRRFEIVPAAGGTAVVETYLDGRRTAMSEPLPVDAARASAAERTRRWGGEVVDHTHDVRAGERPRRVRFRS